MTTTPTYAYYGSLSGAPTASGTDQYQSAAHFSSSLTFSTATASPGQTVNWNVGGGTSTPTYTGFTTPDGGPIIDNNGVFIWLSDTDYSGAQATPADANFSCFLEGTRILTANGEVAVEELAVGDRLRTARDGSLAGIIWIGRSSVEPEAHRRPCDVRPIRVRAGAFGPGQPVRDLFLSPEHAVFVETAGVFFPVRTLVNDSSVVQEPAAGRIVYWHVELAAHDVILAAGLPVETYLDTGNRQVFGPPERARSAVAVRHAACAPLVEDGPLLAATRARLALSAVALGLTNRTFEVRLTGSGRVRALIPDGVEVVDLVSRSTRGEGDRRRLGALVSGIVIDGRTIPMEQLSRARGFHDVERHDGRAVRWTDGRGSLRLASGGQTRVIEIEIGAVAA